MREHAGGGSDIHPHPAPRDVTRRVLVVDDDRAMVRTLSDILTLRGWTADVAYSGDEAVVADADGSYDLVLMDIKMPGMDGVTAFRHIKANRPDARVVLMTAHTEPDVIRAAEDEGAIRVLSKPVDVPSLLALIG